MSLHLWPSLAEELEHRFGEGVDTPWTDAAFDTLAMRTFELQYETVSAFRRFCQARGATPAAVSGWRDIPAVPATALKHLELCVAGPELTFRTSGTTRGSERRGQHLVARASLYRASLLPPFATHLIAGEGPMRFISLIPSPQEVPDSSLSFMVGTAADVLSSGTDWLVDARGRLDESRLRAVMAEAAEAGRPVLLLGTALALFHAVERLEAKAGVRLPEGSRIMETGGFKGVDRAIGRHELYGRLAAATGVPESHIVSEYGMTELLSQLYEPVLSEGVSARGVHVPPPWLKVRALDPTTLEEVPEEDEGLLCFFDLANAGSVCHMLTEDVGVVRGGRVRLRGRVKGSEPRGCSRAMDELMTAAGAIR